VLKLGDAIYGVFTSVLFKPGNAARANCSKTHSVHLYRQERRNRQSM
jgi:hypothetical protein